ncbi:MAG: ribonuclease D [Flavobacteriales bacterium]|jgi:ribonuclease D
MHMSEELLKQEIEWVDSNHRLEELCELWREKPIIALDTEFIRSKTYYPITGLIQVNDGDKNYLLDPKGLDDYYPLVELFDQENITFALHSCSEDLEVFSQELGCIPRNIFDTQVACAILGYGHSMGYAATVEQVLDVSLPKSETRSDWLQRPLSQSQIFYAALDVEYLYILVHALIERLEDIGRLTWVIEEGATLFKNYKGQQDASHAYLRIKSAWKLSPRQLAGLVALSKWRENTAQSRDLPRNQVLKESAVFQLAQLMPKHMSQLRDIEGFSDRVIRRDGHNIMDILSSAESLSEDALPTVLAKPLNKTEQEELKQIRACVREFAGENSISPEILLKKKIYEHMVRYGYSNGPETDSNDEGYQLQGWRLPFLDAPLKEYFSKL